MSRRVLSAVDIFAGAGGLSLGVRRAGFRVRAAVELNETVVATYERNHPGVRVLNEDVRQVTGQDLVRASARAKIDLLMGCAPCEGFCSLTRKYKREDPRNVLILEMARLVEEMRPEAVLMENVPGLETRGRHLLDEFVARLRTAGYYPQWWIVQMANYGVPQNRRRLVLLAGRGFAVPLPNPTHARLPRHGSGLKKWLSLRSAIGGERWPRTLTSARRHGGPRRLNWHVVRNIQPQTKARLQAAVPGKTWRGVDPELRPECHQGDYQGFGNVYGRMTWEQLPVAMTAGCTTPAKGRFGHPDRRRTTISVREAATLQTFPKTYRFATEQIDQACEQIGNAVPPAFAECLGGEVGRSIRQHHAALARRSH